MERNGKWLILTSKENKDKVKSEVEKVLSKLTLQILTLDLTQPGTLSRPQRNPELFSYATALQKEAKRDPSPMPSYQTRTRGTSSYYSVSHILMSSPS